MANRIGSGRRVATLLGQSQISRLRGAMMARAIQQLMVNNFQVRSVEKVMVVLCQTRVSGAEERSNNGVTRS